MQFFLERGRCVAAGELAAQAARNFSAQEHLTQLLAILTRIAARRTEAVKPVQPEPGLVVNQAFTPLLEAHRLSSYSALAEARDAQRIEYNWGKQIHLFRLASRGRPVSLYLKRYRSRLSWSDWLRRLMGSEIIYEGMKEWNSILALRARSIPTMAPVAAGKRLLANGRKESFVLTLGLDDHVPLDHYIGRRFVPPLDAVTIAEKHRLVAAAARLARQLHWSGFNHRDFYLCHLFARPIPGGVEDLKIIDLQRVGYRRPLSARWIVKDLAALYYSSLALPLTNWDRLRFYALYGGGQSRQKRRLRLRWLLRKSAAIARHDQKLGQSNLQGRLDPRGGGSPLPGAKDLETPEHRRRQLSS
jgi:hypothetical protein